MALLFIEGFEQYNDENELGRGGWAGSFSSAIGNIITGRNGGKAMENRGTTASVTHGFPATDFFVFGHALIVQDRMVALRYMNFYSPGGTLMIALQITAAGEIQILRGTTLLEETVGLNLGVDIWYYIELKILIHDSTGTYDLVVDGINVLSDVNQDTRNGTPTEVNLISFLGSGTLDPAIDDIYILDDAGSDNVDLLGDVRVETVFPDADGATNDFTRFGGGSNNFEAVDDGTTPDDDTTYNHSITAAHKELYGFAALTGNVGTVFAVDVAMLVKKEDAGSRTFRLLARSNTSEVESVDKSLGVEYRFLDHIFENDPDGGGDWDEAAVNAAQFGFKIQT